MALLLALALLIPSSAAAQGLAISVSVNPSRASVGEEVSVSGYLHYFNENTLIPLFVSEAYFVVHHGAVSRVTTNLLQAAVPMLWSEWLEVTTNFTIQPGDPQFLQFDFVVGYSLDPGATSLFRSQFPGQVMVLDAVRPALTISSAGPGRLLITWPMQYRDWQLEFTSDLGQVWRSITNEVEVNDETCRMEIAQGSDERMFFRLRR